MSQSIFNGIFKKYSALCISALVLCSLFTDGAAAADASGKFTLTALEMQEIGRGAGLALVLQTPGGHTYLYDTGLGYPSPSDPSGWVGGFNAGRDRIAPFLKQHSIQRIDGVVISHAHLDHYGGLLWLVDHFPIGKLYDTGYEFPGELSPDWKNELHSYTELRNRFKVHGAYQEVHAGDKLPWDNQLEVEVIAPPRQYFSEPHPEQRSVKDPPAHYLVNANSTEIRIRHGQVVFLLPGDIEKEDQVNSLLPSTAPGKFKCDILVAPGHGINSCQSPEFAAASRPKIVIASLLAHWLPNNASPALYGKYGGKVYFTAKQGWIEVTSDGSKYGIQTERSDDSGSK
jgi:competence protein ComEC